MTTLPFGVVQLHVCNENVPWQEADLAQGEPGHLGPPEHHCQARMPAAASW